MELRKAVRHYREKLLDLLYPPRCAFCGDVHGEKNTVCTPCRHKLAPIDGATCERCGGQLGDCVCGPRRVRVTRAAAAFYYEDPVDRALLRFKSGGHAPAVKGFAPYLEDAVMREFAGIVFDCIVPVPSSAGALARRGYNPASLLAFSLSERFSIPVTEGLIRREDTGVEQKGLSINARFAHVSAAFLPVAEDMPLLGKTVLLVDDVRTTGATLDRMAELLRLLGAEHVYSVVLAVARPPKTSKNVKKSHIQ